MTIANNMGADCGDPLLSPLSYSGIYVDVKKEDNQGTSGIGKEHGLTPVHLTRSGWSKDSIKPGGVKHTQIPTSPWSECGPGALRKAKKVHEGHVGAAGVKRRKEFGVNFRPSAQFPRYRPGALASL